ncbi:MAG: hypothetical protein JWP81_3269 [Ferruginibacter sp.]|nr:hypothetical protein [Ferruginibacter sp.]
MQRTQTSEHRPTEQRQQSAGDVIGQPATVLQGMLLNISQVSSKALSDDFAKGTDKTIDILLKPELANERLPFDLSPAAIRKKKKKKSQRLRR